MKSLFLALATLALAASFVVAGCTQAAPPLAPTSAPAAPTKAAEPTKAAATAAPTKPAAPTAQPTAAPAKKVTYPVKGQAITLIVPFAAGGATDTGVRIIAAGLEKEFGSTVQVSNRPGASTQVALTELVASKPDGYTVSAFSLGSSLITYLDPERKATYTPKDLQAVAGYSTDPIALAVSSDSPYKSAKDFIEAAKAKPGEIKLGAAGLMAAGHLGALVLGEVTGAEFSFVNFEGGAPAVTALIGGHIDAVATTVGSVFSSVKSGQLRALALWGDKESMFTPGAKTFKAQGYDVPGTVVMGFVVPTGTPVEVVNTLSEAIKKVLATEDTKKRMTEVGIEIDYMDTNTFNTVWREMEPWTLRALKRAAVVAK